MVDITQIEPTIKEYQIDGYKKESFAWVDGYGFDEQRGQFLIFSNTIFYPNGGGQKGDRGIISFPEEIVAQAGIKNDVAIVDTRKDGDVIQHFMDATIDENILEEYIVGSEKFKISINWDFRYAQMRLHSTAHLLHCFIEKVIGKSIEYPSYSELFDDKGINRYPYPDALTKKELEEVVKIQNKWTEQGHVIKTYKSKDANDPEWFRYWECEEFVIPCGGLHPKNTNEIGGIQATVKLKKDSTSLTFRLEK